MAWSPFMKTGFQANLETKISEAGNAENTKVKAFFEKHIDKIIKVLNLTLIPQKDFLIVESNTDYFVYFGAMTKTWVYVACWMVVSKKDIEDDNADAKPKLLFWFLNTYYVQQLQSLEQTKINVTELERLTDLQTSPEYL